MYQSTAAFGDLIQQDSRTFQALISFDDNIITDGIKNIKLNGGSNSEDDFSIGSSVSQYVEISIKNTGIQFEGHEFYLQIGSMIDGLVEYIPMGYFTAEKPDSDEEQISFTAYDRMMKMERPCFLDLPDTTTTVAVLNAISTITGVQVITTGLAEITMQKPVGYTCREVLSYISQMYGGFAICNRQGQIEIKTYEDNDYTVQTNRYWNTFKHNDLEFVLEKLTCYTGKDEEGNDVSVSAGSGAREISFSNPFMTQAMMDDIWTILQNYTYMPGSFKFLGDPRVDPWDILTVTDRNGDTWKVPAMKLTQEYDGGLSTTVEAVGKSEAEQSSGFQGPGTKQMDRYYAQLVIIDKAMINKLDVDKAKITYATIQNLDVVNETVQNLSGQFGDFQNLTASNFDAANAKIEVLQTTSADIKSLLSGNAGVGDLQNIHLTSQNAVIDTALIREAILQIAYIKDLMTGRISTNEFQIGSDDGGIQIVGATQQWTDSNGVVRMQAGRDANGNFTFSLFDETGNGVLIDSTGIKEGAIADGLIVNDMVADNAGISGSKLDIESVIREINGSSQTINSSRIWFDAESQTLTQLYTQMSNNIIAIDGTASAASETASAASETAQKALSVLSGISTLDALGASLSNDAHVVHTNTDGSGGDYSECHTKMTVYLGDTDVSDDTVFTATPSAGITGYWDAQSRTYYVTAMTSDDGYVDIDALYGTGDRYLTNKIGEKLTTRTGDYLVVRSGGSHISKRFSISKAPDGKIGMSYSLQASVLAIRKQQDDTLVPASVTFSALKNDNGMVTSYSGRYKIEESTDSTTYTTKYESSADETMKIYIPSSASVKSIRCTLYSSGGGQQLDIQTVIVLTDADGLAGDIADVQEDLRDVKEVVQTTNIHVANLQSSVNGINLSISDITTDLQGLTDNTLLYNVKYNNNGDGTTTLTAQVYKDGKDITSTIPERWFTWYRRTESEETYLGYGRSIKVNNSDYGFGGVCVGRFITYDTLYLTTRTGNRLMTRTGNYLTVWKEN